jgi:glucose/arabinose dehydrogenase
MTKPLLAALFPLALSLASCSPLAAGDSVTKAAPDKTGAFTVTPIATFNEPWAIAPIPGSPFALITEKAGTLKLWQADGPVQDVAGLPAVAYGGQGGLGDVVLAPDYASSGLIYLSWAEAGPGDTRGAVVARAKLVLDEAPRLDGLRVIWRQSPKTTGKGHYSHRMAFSPDGKYLFVASGDRQKMAPAQDMAGNLGKVVRLLPDGTPAPGNPFAGQGGVAAQVWSLGHRNILGLAFDAEGRLWDLEHGPAGGDEFNLVKPGANYGWPLVSQGDHYSGRAIPRHPTRPDMAAPAVWWNPVIAPGNFVFYSGTLWPQWKDQALIAGLASGGLVRVRIDGEKATEVARHPLGERIRAIAEAEDGSLLALEDGTNGRLLRLTPAKP